MDHLTFLVPRDGATPADVLRAAIEASGIPRAELARRVGVHYHTVWRWMHGNRTPTADHLVRALVECARWCEEQAE